jgi:threonine aldolase
MQLASKMRFISAQFEALLSNDLWQRNAAHANRMAALLTDKLSGVSGITITQRTEANAVYAIIPRQHVAALQKKAHFYIWDENLSEARLMTSFATTEKEIEDFVELVKQVCK